MIRVKICGIGRPEEAAWAVEAGADAVGVVFADSPRRVTPEKARRIARSLPPFVTLVGVFVDEDPRRILRLQRDVGFHAAQLHGRETAADRRRLGRLPVIKAIPIAGPSTLPRRKPFPAEAFLLDSAAGGRTGGTGKAFDWSLAARLSFLGRIILAGGLTPKNVDEAIRAAGPYAVDVSSGVESSPGRKDRELIRAFVAAAHAASEIRNPKSEIRNREVPS